MDYGFDDEFEHATALMVAAAPAPRDRAQVRGLLERVLRDAVQRSWQGGWRPIDLHHLLAARKDKAVVEPLGDVMALDLAGFAPAR